MEHQRKERLEEMIVSIDQRTNDEASNYDSFVCTSYDDFLQDKDQAVWYVTLSDGSSVFQDDDRPGFEPIAWLRLKNHCEINKLNITGIFVKFRSHVEFSGSSDEGYFFRRKALGGWGMEKTDQYYVIGTIKDGVIHCKHWKIPEVICDEEDDRDAFDEDAVKFKYEDVIIWSNKD